MKIINYEDINNLNIQNSDLINLVDETLRDKKNCILPAKISMHLDGGIFYNVMPSIIPNKKVAGVKLVNRYPERDVSLKSNMMLYDLISGDIKCVMDADYITTKRTAAVAVHSIKILAKKNYSVISFLGMGEIGKATLKCYLDTTDTSDVKVGILNYKGRAKEIIKEFKHYKVKEWVIFDNYEELAKESDIIVSSVTYQEKDFAKAEIYKKGCLIIPIHTRGFMECDLTFDKVFCDDKSHVSGFRYYPNFESKLSEISEVLLGVAKGRENDDERILCYNIGISLHDVALAEHIYNRINN